MNIRVKVKANSKKGPLISEKDDENGVFFEVFVREPAIDGRANRAVISILSDHFNIPKTKITHLKGAKSKIKIFQIKSSD